MVTLTTTLCMGMIALGPFAFGMVVDYLGYTAAWAMLILTVLMTALPVLSARARRPT
ncbi:hypothetical protein [Roseomonas sp. KE2513]|uniref:hypothetical protein n=1 Tax=Roseomonas sp. KE2513 TaxID=2479202 RepID=UPI0018DF9753|nr:hypothetical protein [Roseomonas sp. KE2513]